MRLLICSETGYSQGYTAILEREGHSVDIWSGPGTGLSDTSYSVAIMDSPLKLDLCQALQSRGTRVLGVSSWSRILEMNNEYRKEIIKAIGYQSAENAQGERVSVCCWFNGHTYLTQYLVFNYTTLMSGDLGVTVPSAGYMAYFDVAKSKLVQSVLKPLEKFLRKVNHKGCFTIDCICNEKGVFVEDISASITVPYTQAIYENTSTNKGDVLLSILDETSKPIKHLDTWACGILVSAYPYPAGVPTHPIKIDGITTANLKHSWIVDAAKKGSVWTTSGCLGFITARGTTPSEASRRVYRTLKNIKMDGMQYRNDIGRGIFNRLNALKAYQLI